MNIWHNASTTELEDQYNMAADEGEEPSVAVCDELNRRAKARQYDVQIANEQASERRQMGVGS